MRGPFRECLDIVVIFHHAEPVSGGADICMLADHGNIIDVKNATPTAISFGRPTTRWMKATDSLRGCLNTTTSPRSARRQAPVRRTEWLRSEGIARAAIGKFGDEQVVTDLQRRIIEPEGILNGSNRSERNRSAAPAMIMVRNGSKLFALLSAHAIPPLRDGQSAEGCAEITTYANAYGGSSLREMSMRALYPSGVSLSSAVLHWPLR